MGRPGQEAVIGIVARTNVRVRQPRDYGEIVAKILDDLEERGELLILARALGEESGGVEPERRVDTHHAARRLGAGCAEAVQF
jgi:hypothetical protein